MSVNPHTYKGAFVFPVRVYFEDTDAGGIVYYANYLKYMERARTELSRHAGFCHSETFNEGKGFLVVRDVNVKYLQPAYLDDLIDVHTHVTAIGKIRIEMAQVIRRGEVILAQGHVNLVNVNQERKPAPMDPEFIRLMGDYLKEK